MEVKKKGPSYLLTWWFSNSGGGGISMDTRIELMNIERGSTTANRYIEDTLLEYIVRTILFLKNFIFPDDNVRQHWTKQEYAMGISILE